MRVADGGGEQLRGGRGEHELQVAVLDEPLQRGRPRRRRRLALASELVELELPVAVAVPVALAVHHVLLELLRDPIQFVWWNMANVMYSSMLSKSTRERNEGKKRSEVKRSEAKGVAARTS